MPRSSREIIVLFCLTLCLPATAQTVQKDNVPATSVTLKAPQAIAADHNGNIFFADNNAVYKVDNTGILTRVAGTGLFGFSGDGGPAVNAQVWTPTALGVDGAGNLYIADEGNNRIRKVSSGVITTIAGTGKQITGVITSPLPGDRGLATSAPMLDITTIAVDDAGNVYIAQGGAVRKVSNGIVDTVAGCNSCRDNNNSAPDSNSGLPEVTGIASGPAGDLYIAQDAGCYNAPGGGPCLKSDLPGDRIRRFSNGIVTLFAGNGTRGYGGDNGPATDASFKYVGPIVADTDGILYIGDLSNGRIRKVSNGIITTIAGNGTNGLSGDNGPALSAQFGGGSLIYSLATDGAGNLYVADPGNKRIRRISKSGIITTVAGGGTDPAISAGGVVQNSGKTSKIASGSWITIYGNNFSDGIHEAVGGFLPELAGVTVFIDSKPAFISYVSPTQINCQAPDHLAVGPVTLAVKSTSGLLATSTVNVAELSPTFSLFADGSHAAGVILRQDGGGAYQGGTYDLLGPVNLFSFLTRPVARGEILVLYGVGFGETTPFVPAGLPFSGSAPTIHPVDISIGGVKADVLYSGMTSTGLYQFNLIVPDVQSGDQKLEASVNGVAAETGSIISIQ